MWKSTDVIYLLNKRLQQHRDDAEGKRNLRLKDEMAALDNYGTSFTLQDILQKGPNSMLLSIVCKSRLQKILKL